MRYRSKHISAIGSGVIAQAGGGAELGTINVNTGAGSAILTIYNGVSSAGTVVAVIDASTKSSHAYVVLCEAGIFYDLAGGNADITIGHG